MTCAGVITYAVIAGTLFLASSVHAGYEVSGSTVNIPIGSVPAHEQCSGVYCPPEGRCHNGGCICNTDLTGKGAIGCFSGNVQTCMATSDVTSVNLQKDHIDIPSPCQYQMSNMRFSVPSKSNVQLKCGISVYASNVRYQGKLFVGAFDLSFNIKPVDALKAYFLQFRGLGHVDTETNEYVFQPRVRAESKFPWFEPGEVAVDYDYVFEVDEAERRLRFEMPDCGFKLMFRPAHPTEGKDQTFLPGLVFAVDEDVGEIDWNLPTTTVCLAPPGEGVETIEDIGLDDGFAGNPEMTLAKMVYSEKKLYTDYLPDECQDLRTEVDNCPDDESLNRAVLDCTSILTKPLFVACFSALDQPGYTTSVTELFTECVSAFCDRDTVACTAVQQRINGACPDDLEGVVMATHSCTF